MIPRDRWIPVCPAPELADGQHRCLDVLYAGEPVSALVIRFGGEVYAYRNQCVHMVRRLDCEDTKVFDDEGKRLRCSMHGIVYQPESGACLSEICNGQSLTRIKVTEAEGYVYIADKRVKL